MTRNYSRACKSKTILASSNAQEFKHVKKKIHEILLKHRSDLSPEDKIILQQYKHIAKAVEAQRQSKILRQQRELEVEDDVCTLKQKCTQFVQLIQSSKSIVVYTGAGISTSASIPDYRGPNGVWTQLKHGYATPQVSDLVVTEPTYTHQAIAQLVRRNIVHHVVSQNCDGLHRRSGVPQELLSEIHGNIFIEVCKHCRSIYTRSFDVTERTALRRHATGRKCHTCPPDVGTLIDTIVHFGEKGKLKYPLNWEAASKAAQNADLIICLGSSLKVLRKYGCLWPKNKKKAKLIIINLQWTPKDSQATLKINGKCDVVMREVMSLLNIPINPYDRRNDPIYLNSIALKPDEKQTCNRVKLEDMLTSAIDLPKVTLTPSWFGIGVRRK